MIMAYTFFPKSTKEIDSKIKHADVTRLDEIKLLFNYIKNKFPKIETPITIDPNSINVVKVTRLLDGDINILNVKRELKITKTSIKFGNGSAGGRGVNNKGNQYEQLFANDLNKWFLGETITDTQTLNAFNHINSLYNITKHENVYAKTVGELNTKRPLIYSPSVLISSPVVGLNMGKVLSDITIKSNDKDLLYLSLKNGNTVTFFNSGVKKALIQKEIESEHIKNKDGLKLLKLFDIDVVDFCKVFNGTLKKGYSKDVWKDMSNSQKADLNELLKSGIGYGYHVIHKISGKILSYQVDKAYMEKAALPTSCTVYYGGRTGTGKRIDMVIETAKYILKLNIRDKQGSGGYPTHLMCDFTHKV